MLKPRHSFLITAFLKAYISQIINRHFYRVVFNDPGANPGKSILLIANHFSWWDGFLLYHLNKILFKKTFHAMVLEETMHKVGIFKYLGGFPIAKNPKQMIASLNYAAGLLDDPDNMVVIFPQGKLYSNFVDDVNFEKGLFKIVQGAEADFQYVFAAAFIENFERKKPTAYINLQVYPKAAFKTVAEIQYAYQQHYQTAKLRQTTIII